MAQRTDWVALALKAMIISALAAALGLVLWVRVWGADRPAETRVDLFDGKNRREGYATIDRTGRIDRFDTHGRRQDGYGIIDRRDGRVDVFDGNGQRKGYGTTNGSRGGKR